MTNACTISTNAATWTVVKKIGGRSQNRGRGTAGP
jgi:hypothetical protein